MLSADTFKDERDPKAAPPYYKVTLRVDVTHLTERQRNLQIKPGDAGDGGIADGGEDRFEISSQAALQIPRGAA